MAREQNNQTCLKLLFRTAAYVIKISANREQNKQACLKLFVRDAAYIIQISASRAECKELAQFAHELRVDGLGLRVKLANAL